MAFRGLFIGIDRYASPAVSWLTCARRDATALQALAADTFAVTCTLLTDGQATRAAIEREFVTLAACGPEDVVFISFSGHGTTTHELVTYDADVADLPNTCVPLSVLTEWFSRVPARRLVCVLDCCFSGGMGAKVLISDLMPRDLTSPDAALNALSGEGRLILTASLATEPAWETTRAGHGLLTYHLLAALQGAEEVRQAGKVPVYQLLHYVTKRVTDAAAAFGKEQHPTVRGQMDGELAWPVFTAGPAYAAAFPERARPQATADVVSLGPLGFPDTLVAAWAGKIPSLNALQLSAVNEFGVLRGAHVVVSAPTSSGKTMVGELAALRGILDRRRAVFLLPLKALVNDKHRYFTEVYRPLGVQTILATGDASPDIPAFMRGQYDVALLTYEKFGALLLGSPHVLEQVGTIVIDEVQMIADKRRGANLEFILTLLRTQRRHGVEPQVIALSAVIGDTNGLERWLGARLLRRDERPVPLREGILLADGRFRHLDPQGQEQVTEPLILRRFDKGSGQDWIIPLVARLVSEGKQVIVFRETKGEARGCAKYLAENLALPPATVAIADLPGGDPSNASADLRRTLAHGIAFHTADLDRDERSVVERNFRTPRTPLRVIVSTTTLAMGINTPAEAVIIEGLEHPGPQPYSVAEYKNMVGRAGRLGLAQEGTSYLLAWDGAKAHHYWNAYVLGKPEDIESRFIARETDPRSLLLRVLAGAGQFQAGGISFDDAIAFLLDSFAAFQRKQAAAGWTWDRRELERAFSSLERHALVTRANDGRYHLTELGRFAGEGGVEVESIVRLVDALSGVDATKINDPALIVTTQLTAELDAMLFPINKRSTQKEPRTWAAELRGQEVPERVLAALHRNVTSQHQGTLRAKKAVACLLWVSGRPMDEVERVLTQFGGAFDGAAGPVRAVSARTCDLLSAAARVAGILHPSLRLEDRLRRLLVRLDVGVPAVAVELASNAGDALGRGDYQRLVQAGLVSIGAIEVAPDESLLPCVGMSREKVQALRAAVGAARRGPPAAVAIPAPVLPAYEG